MEDLTPSILARQMAEAARAASLRLPLLQTAQKDRALRLMATRIRERSAEILRANAEDLAEAKKAGLSDTLLQRLQLDSIERVARILEGVADQPEPVGAVERVGTRKDGVRVARVRVPLGVVALIYEARPSATVAAVALCLKSANAVILRGGSEALRTNRVLEGTLREVAMELDFPPGAFALFPRALHADVDALLALGHLIDLVVPRGGEQLISHVQRNATMPVLRHGSGVCHLVVDAPCDIARASEALLGGKCRNPSVCNATECVVVVRAAAPAFWAEAGPKLRAAGVEVRGDAESRGHLPWAKAADPSDYGKEFLELTLAARVVDDFDGAIDHVQKFGTHHTEAVFTSNREHAQRFTREIDASAVVVNGSTRLNELDAQFGISTSKLHAYGPMGLQELTTTKWLIDGDGSLFEAPPSVPQQP